MTKKLEAALLKQLRLTCLDWPETSEKRAWGHPNFRAGAKTFAVLETYKGFLSLALKVGLDRQKHLLEDRRFYATPYVAKQGWVSLMVAPETLRCWSPVRKLLLDAYRSVALKRMLAALEDT